MLIYKIFRPSEFALLETTGATLGAPVDLKDGFVHFSTAKQLHATLTKHFSGESPLHLLALDDQQLPELRWEPSRGGDLFPHLYRELRQDDILWSRTITFGPDGHDIGELE